MWWWWSFFKEDKKRCDCADEIKEQQAAFKYDELEAKAKSKKLTVEEIEKYEW